MNIMNRSSAWPNTMTRYLLDTNIVSHATKPSPSDTLLRGMAKQADLAAHSCNYRVIEIRN